MLLPHILFLVRRSRLFLARTTNLHSERFKTPVLCLSHLLSLFSRVLRSPMSFAHLQAWNIFPRVSILPSRSSILSTLLNSAPDLDGLQTTIIEFKRGQRSYLIRRASVYTRELLGRDVLKIDLRALLGRMLRTVQPPVELTKVRVLVGKLQSDEQSPGGVPSGHALELDVGEAVQESDDVGKTEVLDDCLDDGDGSHHHAGKKYC